ncbi:hypothetical protein [Neobacillus dielmonensis]|uniref:hypothetical protein n=1 Tax=Neobacillus dielmonensis TaxID=1347369 RepID=UPI000A889640|nr:hypothetical protein [Neobacillus dielmonensis]
MGTNRESELRQFCERVLEKAGVKGQDAVVVAESLIRANLVVLTAMALAVCLSM